MIEKCKAVPKKVYAGLCAVIVVIIAIVAVALNHKETINLNKYLSINTYGYDGYGTVGYSIDWDAIRDKYEDKLHFTHAGEKVRRERMDYDDPILFIEDNIILSFDDENGLSNGDTVKYSWEIEQNISKYVNCKLKAKNGKHKITDLTKLEKFDPFNGLEVKYSGIAPYGTAEIDYDGDDLDVSDFNCDNTENLKNGDKVTVFLSDTDMEDYIDSIGKIPDRTTKEYTVSGLIEYVTSYDSLTDDFIKESKKEAEDCVYSYAAELSDYNTLVNNIEYAGYVFNTLKDVDDSDNFYYDGTFDESNNSLYLIYKGDISSTDGSFSPKSAYFPVEFEDIIKDGDSLSYDNNCGIVGRTTLNGIGDSINAYINPLKCYTELVDKNKDRFTSECGDGFELFSESSDINKLSDISEAFKKTMRDDAKDRIESYIAKLDSNTHIDNLSLKGEYLLVSKSQTIDEDSNKYIVVYSARASHSKDGFKTTTVYFPVGYKGIVKLPKDEYMITNMVGMIGESFLPSNSTYAYGIKGYVDGAQMYSDIITKKRDAYTYEVSDGLKEFGD